MMGSENENQVDSAFDVGFSFGQEALRLRAKVLLGNCRTFTVQGLLKDLAEMEERHANAGTRTAESMDFRANHPLQRRLWAASREFRLASAEKVEVHAHLLGYINIILRNISTAFSGRVANALANAGDLPVVFSEKHAMESNGLDFRHDHGPLEMNGNADCAACKFRNGFINGQRMMLTKASKFQGSVEKMTLARLLRSFANTDTPAVLRPDIHQKLGFEFLDFQKTMFAKAGARQDTALKNLVDVYINMDQEG